MDVNSVERFLGWLAGTSKRQHRDIEAGVPRGARLSLDPGFAEREVRVHDHAKRRSAAAAPAVSGPGASWALVRLRRVEVRVEPGWRRADLG